MKTAIVKYEPPPDLDTFLVAMFLIFARAPRRAEPDVDGCFDLGDIGSARGKNWERLTPYSLAKGK